MKGHRISDKAYKFIFESSLDIILVTTPEGMVLDANSAVELLFGYTHDEIIKLNRSQLIDTNDQRSSALLNDLSLKGEVKGEITLIKKDGTKFPAEISAIILPAQNDEKQNLMTIRDITERKHAEEENKIFATMVDTSIDGVTVQDFEGNVLSWNQGAEEIYGYSKSEALESSIYLIIPGDCKDEKQALIYDLKNGADAISIETKRITKDGRVLDIWLTLTTLKDDDGKPYAFTTIERDITEQKKLKEKQQELLEQLKHFNEELTVSNEELQSTTEELRVSNEKLQQQGEELLLVNQALMVSKKHYQQFFDNPLTGFALCEIITDNKEEPVDFVYLDVNQAFENFTGFKKEDVLNKKVSDILPLEEVSEIIKIYGNVALTGESANIEYPIPSLNKYYQIAAFSPEKKQFIAFFTDITQNKKAEENIKMLADVVDSSDDAIITKSLEGIITSWNKGAEKIYGYKAEEVLEQNISILAPYSLKNEISHLIENIKQGKQIDHYETLRVKKDGTLINVSLTLSPVFDDRGKLVAVSTISRDITEHMKAEEKNLELLEKLQASSEELTASNEELQATSEELKTANESLQLQMQFEVEANKELKEVASKLKISNSELEQFAYVSSHDLQEPLRMVASFTQLLERRYKGQLDEDADEYIGFIVEGSQRMKYLIDDLLEFSRLNTQVKEFELSYLEIALEDVLLKLQISIKDYNAKITHEPLPTLMVDLMQIRQLFQNLISNAIKFHGDEPPEIHISAQKNGNEWIFGVSDNGIGIKPEHQELIFGIFKRLHTREEYPGTGIGLSICKRIIERHGGRIWVESEPGKGSTFYFTIPMKSIKKMK
ncbi:MAG: PAS domain S-box protein [Methanobacterium sp.]